MRENPVIVALDVSERGEMQRWAEGLAGHVGMMKIGLELFVRYGPEVVGDVRERGVRVMLDLKLHDIPNTVGRAVRNVAGLGVEMVTLHASGGAGMLRAAREAVRGYEEESGRRGPRLLAVTVLTSIDEQALRGELGVERGMEEQVAALARMAQGAGCDGVVASAREIGVVRAACGRDFLIITPGIRPAGAGHGDQKRVCTPGEAIRAGADYVVMGRPVLEAADPIAVLEEAVREAGRAG